MTNEEQQLLKERFLKNQEIHRQREVESEFHKRRYEETKKSIAETDKIKLSISDIALDLLEELGFERKSHGAEYLADVIETLYHERKVFDGENKFFDFNDKSNNRYLFTNDYYECSLKHIQQNIELEISKSYVSNNTLNEIIYSVANDLISQYDKGSKQLVLNEIKH